MFLKFLCFRIQHPVKFSFQVYQIKNVKPRFMIWKENYYLQIRWISRLMRTSIFHFFQAAITFYNSSLIGVSLKICLRFRGEADMQLPSYFFFFFFGAAFANLLKSSASLIQ